jgi:maltose/moltooligosaccharide transporter
LTQTGWVAETSAGAGLIPQSVHIAFYLGAAVFLACVVYTVVTTKEHPPGPEAALSDVERAEARESLFSAIFSGISKMPLTMRRLAWVQGFTWLGLFCMWIYFTPAVAHGIFGGQPGTPEYQRGVEWGGVCFAVYNGVAFGVAFLLVALTQRGVSARLLYRIGLLAAGLGLLSVGAWKTPEGLLVSMVGVGVGWATILSMPYALLANALPPERMGFFMGVFNLFIVLPQILAATVLGSVVSRLLGGEAMPVVMIGGASMLIAALLISRVPKETATNEA